MLTAVLATAGLFAAYALLLRRRAGCGHDCGMCERTCGAPESDHD